MLMDKKKTVYCDENSQFENEKVSIKVQTQLFSSGLLRVECCMDLNIKQGKLQHIGVQQLNLRPGERITTQVAGNETVRVTVCAKPCER